MNLRPSMPRSFWTKLRHLNRIWAATLMFLRRSKSDNSNWLINSFAASSSSRSSSTSSIGSTMHRPQVARRSCNSIWPKSKSSGFCSTNQWGTWWTTTKFWTQAQTTISLSCFTRSIQLLRRSFINSCNILAKTTVSNPTINHRLTTWWTKIWLKRRMSKASALWRTWCSNSITRSPWLSRAEMEATREAMKRSTYWRSKSSTSKISSWATASSSLRSKSLLSSSPPFSRAICKSWTIVTSIAICRSSFRKARAKWLISWTRVLSSNFCSRALWAWCSGKLQLRTTSNKLRLQLCRPKKFWTSWTKLLWKVSKIRVLRSNRCTRCS